MAGSVPAIHVLDVEKKTWMPGTRPGMTNERFCGQLEQQVAGVNEEWLH
jgi:hypothetical protein